jgi:hypothetical protein
MAIRSSNLHSVLRQRHQLCNILSLQKIQKARSCFTLTLRCASTAVGATTACITAHSIVVSITLAVVLSAYCLPVYTCREVVMYAHVDMLARVHHCYNYDVHASCTY